MTDSANGSEFTSLSDEPLSRTPISANVVTSKQLESIGAKRLSDLNQFDASVSDAYNAAGYWDYATMRGFVIDNKYNYRREGLPINAETFIPLENKAQVDILKGTSGIQAGTSAPGGLVNYVMKRPTQNDVRTIRIEGNSHGSLQGAVDLGGRFGNNKDFGYRINAVAEKIDHYTPKAKGNRQLLAVAADWRVNKDSILEADFEYSRRTQPSVPGVSLTGNTLPEVNNHLNINSQSWSQPVVLEGITGSLKFEQAINSQWRWSAQAGTQHLKSHDRAAFPFGCTDANGVDYYTDRFCPNGDFDLYDYRSENERRRTSAAQLQIKGEIDTGSIKHKLSVGLLQTQARDTLNSQAYNYAGMGNLNALSEATADPSLTTPSTNRNERSTELSAFDAISWTPTFTTWTGLRYSRLHRESIRTDGNNETRYDANFVTPWVAASYQINPSHMLYASYGQGVESEVVANLPRYTNAGAVLPTLKSKQFELGMKGNSEQLRWSAAYFNINRPVSGDLGDCDVAGSCLRQIDGTAKHSGFEFTAATPAASVTQPWHIDAGVTMINAKRQGSTIDASQNGLRPTNVPNWILRFNGSYKIANVPGLLLSAHLSHEGKRAVLPDNSIVLPAWTRLDLAASYDMQIAQSKTTWTLGVDNVLNKRYHKESPYQFGHSYLFPGAPRTLRVALQIAL
ncbi:MAG TPA: TonB-dependent siderophore receptor [Burkholderiaceae bacterium]|nr:TonB-dependent siderophore receptor [Burkholderiaceae bacterium]